MKRISISLLLAALAVGAWAPRPAAAATEVGAQVSCTEAGGAPSTFVINTDSASYDSLVSAAQAMAVSALTVR